MFVPIRHGGTFNRIGFASAYRKRAMDLETAEVPHYETHKGKRSKKGIILGIIIGIIVVIYAVRYPDCSHTVREAVLLP